MAKKHGKSNKKANKSKKKKGNSKPCQNQGLSSETKSDTATIYIISLFFILIVVLFQPGLLSTYESILEKLFSLAILCMKS